MDDREGEEGLFDLMDSGMTTKKRAYSEHRVVEWALLYSLEEYPTLDVNIIDPKNGNISLLQKACLCDYHLFINELLKSPEIQVNYVSATGDTALHYAAQYSPGAIQSLMIDPRVKVNFLDSEGKTAFAVAVDCSGVPFVTKFLGTLRAINMSCHYFNSEVVCDLIDKYQKDRFRYLKNNKTWTGEDYEFVGPVIFYIPLYLFTEGLYEIRSDVKTPITRFLTLSKRLPPELQMRICLLLFESKDEFISNRLFILALRLYIADHFIHL